jgi:hypothetical protein
MSVETISAADVKKLRQSTGAGMMDCKKALKECGSDFEKATEWLRQKGLSGADKKAGRAATEGAVARYIHPGSRLGVLIEVNCETDFVAASEQFQSLVSELGMIVASTDVVCVSAEDMPGDLLEKERQVGPLGAWALGGLGPFGSCGLGLGRPWGRGIWKAPAALAPPTCAPNLRSQPHTPSG